MELRSKVFDSFANDYDLFRPRYPQSFARDVSRHTNLSSDAKLLEIGCGSGQATDAFAKLGYEIEALDPSESLISIAKRNFSATNKIKFHCLQFEEYDSSISKFDFIFSANAFHWVKPEIGWEKVANLLKPKGCFSNMAIKRELEPDVRIRLDNLYRKYKSAFSSADLLSSTSPSPVSATTYQEKYFILREKITEEVETVYDPDTYVGLMQTMSDHRVLPAKIQNDFFSELKDLCQSLGNIRAKNKVSAQIYQKKMS